MVALSIPAILAVGFVELSHAALDAFLQALPLRRLGLGLGPPHPLAQALRALLASLGFLTHGSLPVRRAEVRTVTIVRLTAPYFPFPLALAVAVAVALKAFAAGFAPFSRSIWARHSSARALVDSPARAVRVRADR